ncbi:MAG: tetratricopeptide repeat protein [Candidatus Rariloculaceae bacterium]
MRIVFAVVALVLVGLSAAFALEIDYSSTRNIELRACDTHLYRGRRSEAELCYGALLTKSQDARIRGEASWGLGDLRTANSYFQTAVEIYPEDAHARARWGGLYLATHQDSDAVKLFEEALSLDPELAEAKLGLASVSAGRFEDRARELINEVLEKNPERVDAHLLLAQMHLEEGALEEAEKVLTEALEIVLSLDMPPLEIYALNASGDLLRDITDSPWTDRALAYNPRYGEIYSTPAYFYVITRRYRQAIELLQQAVTIQPDLWAAHSELGVNLLRENRVDEAQRHLTIAYRGDPFSAKIVNTLRLIDSFDNFKVITHSPRLGGESDFPGIILRLHNEEADVLEPYVVDLVSRSIETFTARYQFNLEEPVIVELYPDSADFSVRTSGLPGIGLLGVTFGYLVAMDSPSGRPEGDFHWGTTLWHEMAHVFTLEATDHLVPRWFSEGVSVFEEWSTGPLPGRHIPLHVLQAMEEDKFLPVADLDSGFIRPTYDGQIMVSYMQAGLICQYIENRWGQSGLVGMLEGFRDGTTTSEAILLALGVTPDVFDNGFQNFIENEFEGTLAGLGDWREHLAAASEAMSENNWENVIEAADKAIVNYPDHVAENSAYLYKARAHDQLQQRSAALQALERYWRGGGYDPSALNQLARWLFEEERKAEAIAVAEAILQVAPLDNDLHIQLGDWLLAEQMPEVALREYEASLAMNPHDQAAAHYRLATAYRQLEDDASTLSHVLYALEIAPHYREAQQLLLEIAR